MTAAPPAEVNRLRPRRSCLAVPGSNPRFLEKAQRLPADQVAGKGRAAGMERTVKFRPPA